MTLVTELKHYNDIRGQVPFEVFRNASTYISWHNRLTMTDMLEVWEGLVVAYAFEQKKIDPFLFPSIKQFLAQTGGRVPYTSEDCRTRAYELLAQVDANR